MLLTTELRPGGAERVVHDLACGLDRSVVEPVVAALDGRGVYAERIRKSGVEVIDLGATRCRDLAVIWRLRRHLRERSIDLLHTHLIHAAVIGRLAARPLGIPTLSTAHIVDRRPVWWHFALDRWTARWCMETLCVSEAVKQFLMSRTGLPDAHYHVLHNGIDLARFEDLPEKNEARAALGLPGGELLIGALGRFERQKGLDIFLHALSILDKRGDLPSWRAAVAGYGPEEEALRSLASSLELGERLHWAGYREAEAFFPALDVVAFPSRWEGFGLVLVEAFAAGCAVVASGVDSIPEIATHEKDALLVAPDDPDALAHALAGVLLDPVKRNALAAAAHRRSGDFALQRMLSAHAEVYRAALATFS